MAEASSAGVLIFGLGVKAAPGSDFCAGSSVAGRVGGRTGDSEPRAETVRVPMSANRSEVNVGSITWVPGRPRKSGTREPGRV